MPTSRCVPPLGPLRLPKEAPERGSLWRLALAIASDVAEHHENGAAWVDLAPRPLAGKTTYWESNSQITRQLLIS